MAPFTNAVALGLLAVLAASAQVQRIVVVKVDGLPGWYVEQAVAAGRAPWIEHIFHKNGVHVPNFYTRGISLSVPSWQVLDTGVAARIHGNAEFDRYSSHVYDYLNFFPFYVDYGRRRASDMPSVEVLDEERIPLLLDRFPAEQRYQAFQLNQRGVRYRSLPKVLTARVAGRQARQLIDEWQAGGLGMGEGVYTQMERELVEKLQDPNVRYLDFFSGDFDHQAHLTMDAASHAAVFEKLDKLVGRIHQAILKTPGAARTALALVSDHGMNTTPGVYSQGFNLVNYFVGPEGGGHHVVTNRHTLQEYKLMGLDPWVYRVTTASDASPYLDGRHKDYPTVLLDLDGNERASVYFRNNHLNRLHMALLKGNHKLAMRVVDSQRAPWTQALAAIREEIARLAPLTDGQNEDRKLEQDRRGPAKDRKPTSTRAPVALFERASRQDDSIAEVRRVAQFKRRREAKRKYEVYAASLDRVLALDLDQLAARKHRIEDLVPPGAMGELNTPEDLQSYAVALGDDGTFRTIDYLAALTALRTRNQVQKELSLHPIDFVATMDADGSVLAYAGPDKRVRITREIAYRPLDGWKEGLPLRLWEDPEYTRGREWLAEPHAEAEWFAAVHRTRYSNGIVGLLDQFNKPISLQRAAARADLLIHANDHWNFNVRGFNPGGNHGGFLRISTHSTLMFWGGAETGIAKGKRVEGPYDGLSFVPTVLSLMGLSLEGLAGPTIPLGR